MSILQLISRESDLDEILGEVVTMAPGFFLREPSDDPAPKARFRYPRRPTVTLRNRARPRYETKPTKGAKTWQRDLWRTADKLGTPFLPWQKKAGRLLAELRDELCDCRERGIGNHDPMPLPLRKTVVASVPRQQGKTVLSRTAVTTKAESKLAKDDRGLEIYGTAQTRAYAAKHVVALGDKLGARVKTNRGIGNELVEWNNGTTYKPIPPTRGGGHGDSIDFMLIDEGWTVEIATLGGVTPAMIARPHSQLLVISTMGTVDSEVWNGFVKSGREGDDPTMAYLEYSAPTDEAVFEDDCEDDSRVGTKDCVWGQWMPALGLTVTHADIRAAMNTLMKDPALGRNEIVRAFGNRTVKQLVTLFPSAQLEKAWRVVDPPERFVLALDVNNDPAGASVSTGHMSADGAATARLIEWRYGSPRWLPEYVENVIRQRDVDAVIADFGGPSREVRAEIEAICEANLIPLVDRRPRDFAADCARFYDGLNEETTKLERSQILEESLAGAQRKTFSDTGLWVVSRGLMTVDASPAIAAILAHGLAAELNVTPKVEFYYG